MYILSIRRIFRSPPYIIGDTLVIYRTCPDGMGVSIYVRASCARNVHNGRRVNSCWTRCINECVANAIVGDFFLKSAPVSRALALAR